MPKYTEKECEDLWSSLKPEEKKKVYEDRASGDEKKYFPGESPDTWWGKKRWIRKAAIVSHFDQILGSKKKGGKTND